MDIWPGNKYFGYRYDYATEYVKVMKELWAKGVSDFKGDHFTMRDCKMSPQPSGDISIVAAGQSGRGMEFAAGFADYNFVMGQGTHILFPNSFARRRLRGLWAKEYRNQYPDQNQRLEPNPH